MKILVTNSSKNYSLLDSGDGEKLENYSGFILRRPEPQAIWAKSKNEEFWNNNHASFTHGIKTGRWKLNKDMQKNFDFELSNLNFNLELLPSKHLGVFPEQSENWSWLESVITKEKGIGKNISVLNLFAYTGGASMIASRAGATVTHVDSSKFAVDLARKNFEKSNIKLNGVRFIVDDVKKFVEREVRRGSKYDVIILDPPVYGRGLKNEVWKIEKDLKNLLKSISKILSPKPIAILINGYSSVYSSVTYSELIKSIVTGFGGVVDNGELAIQEEGSDRLLSSGIYARWSK